MGTFTLAIPASPQFKSARTIDQAEIKNKVGSITFRKENVDIWRRVIQNTKVPATLLFAFAGISGFNQGFVSGSSFGLMSVDTFYGATDPKTKLRQNSNIILNYEKQKLRMTSNETSAFKSTGFIYDDKANSFPNVTNVFLQNYEFNLLMGAIFLGQLIDGDAPLISQKGWNVDARNNLMLERIIVLYYNSCNIAMPSVQMALSGQYPNALSLIQAIEGTDPNSAVRIKQIMGVGGWIDSLKNSATFDGFVQNYNLK
jgi:hypothetical protein